MKIFRTIATTGLLFSLVTLFSSAFAADYHDDMYCSGEFTADDTFYGKVLVGDGHECVLKGTKVHGDVMVYAGGSLDAYGVYIGGSVEAHGAKSVRLQAYDDMGDLQPSKVSGDIKLYELMEYESYISDTEVDGSIELEHNMGDIRFWNIYVYGDIKAFYNYGSLQIGSDDREYYKVEGSVEFQYNAGYVSLSDYYVYGDIKAYYNKGGLSIESNYVFGSIELEGNELDIYLWNNYVYGDVKAYYNKGSLRIGSDDKEFYRIEGSVEIKENACMEFECMESMDFVLLSNYFVYGDVKVLENKIDVRVEENSVKGSILVEKNHYAVYLKDNYVYGDMQVVYNRYFGDFMAYNGEYNMYDGDDYDGVLIQRNEIHGNLQCKDNYPPPAGMGNTVYGYMEDQCMGFDYMESDSEGGTSTSSGDAPTGSSAAASAGARSAESAGGGTSGPLFALMLAAAAMLRLRHHRRLVA